MLLVPIVLLWFPSRLSNQGYLCGLLSGYGLARLAELTDEPIFRALDGISRHIIKYFLAAGAAYVLLLALRRRKPVSRQGMVELERRR